ncbi:hypothetical protein GCM10022403_069530 [Streptomyces coacervatus]|uniref:Secreted protein n=1 Tax=Streptomyces coacervatus TaxID=647381 RepID=A0ABP7ITD5_9ACTN|nr:hypothetical protein [Streptomyces coacervatus]MDF2266627.1 hypothetical protein [Streptomyces coacervatus]
MSGTRRRLGSGTAALILAVGGATALAAPAHAAAPSITNISVNVHTWIGLKLSWGLSGAAAGASWTDTSAVDYGNPTVPPFSTGSSPWAGTANGSGTVGNDPDPESASISSLTSHMVSNGGTIVVSFIETDSAGDEATFIKTLTCSVDGSGNGSCS